MFENPLWRQFFSQRGYTPPMPGNPPKNPEKDFAPLSQNNGYKRLTKYPLDTALSEKALTQVPQFGERQKYFPLVSRVQFGVAA